jgi:hypothetical protein
MAFFSCVCVFLSSHFSSSEKSEEKPYHLQVVPLLSCPVPVLDCSRQSAVHHTSPLAQRVNALLILFGLPRIAIGLYISADGELESGLESGLDF